jgi:hypothetical protein
MSRTCDAAQGCVEFCGHGDRPRPWDSVQQHHRGYLHLLLLQEHRSLQGDGTSHRMATEHHAARVDVEVLSREEPRDVGGRVGDITRLALGATKERRHVRHKHDHAEKVCEVSTRPVIRVCVQWFLAGMMSAEPGEGVPRTRKPVGDDHGPLLLDGRSRREELVLQGLP